MSLKYLSSLGAKITYDQLDESGGGFSFVWLGGLHSDMKSEKLGIFKMFCKDKGFGLTCFEYFAHGDSEGRLEDGSIGTWFNNAIDVLDDLTAGKQILLGFSMGGWIALLIAINRSEKVHAVFGINSAPDFTEDIYKSLSYFQKLELRGGAALDCGLNLPISHAFISGAKRYFILNKTRLSLRCPVHLVHGLEDDIVPYTKSIKILKKSRSGDNSLLLLDGVSHNLSADVFKGQLLPRIEHCIASLR